MPPAASDAHASAPADLRALLGDRLLHRHPLGPLTSWRIGGPADWFAVVTTRDELCAAIAAARAAGLPWLVLGRGSNVLVADAGVRGLVLRVQCAETRIDPTPGVVYAEAGARLATLAAATAARGLAGLEFGVGIPGSIGGAVVMNAGAHGGCIGDVIESATVLPLSGSPAVLARADLALGYRTSRFRHRHDEVVLDATFVLSRCDAESALARLRAFRQRRQDTQPTDASAGSVFRNPPGTAAGLLIDQAGLKGTRVGGAMVSPRHANFIVNVGGATAADVATLIDYVRASVLARHGIALEPEIERIGDWPPPAAGSAD